MSLLRPRWLEDLIPPTPAGTTRLRNLKGFQPEHVPAFQDVLYADDPQFWMVSGFAAAAPALISHIGVQMPNDDSLVVSVDGIIASITVTDQISVDVGSISLNTDASVVKRNRREATRGNVFERVGINRITDNLVATVGTQIIVLHALANTPIFIPLGYRLFGASAPVSAPEQLFVRTTTANIGIAAYMWGRMMAKGAR